MGKQFTVLVTGGLGYIGSHTVVLLLEADYRVVIADNLSNSSDQCLTRIKNIVGSNKAQLLSFHQVNLCRYDQVEKLFENNRFDAVIHFAGKKAVGESVAEPMMYYENNISATIFLIQNMKKYNCKRLVFSSSCTVYGQPDKAPIDETQQLNAISPYGRTKLFVEQMLRDLVVSDDTWCISVLRYFNPVGAHPSGEIGEDPVGIPNNLMPFIQQVAVGRRAKLQVFGSDYNTEDGSCVRDYIHVMDLGVAHVLALKKLTCQSNYGFVPLNLGTGTGTSVLQMISAFERASGVKIPFDIVDRRPGDASAVWAAPDAAFKEIGWVSKCNVDDMCKDQWNWAQKNPYGYTQSENDQNNGLA